MARPKSTDTPALDKAHDLTVGIIDRLVCPPSKKQAFLRDTKAPGLRVRVTAGGAKSFVFEAKLNGQTIRRTIGDARAWTLQLAREEANRQRVVLDGGHDPRALDRQQQAAQAAAQATETATAARQALTVRTAWGAYLADRKEHWGTRHHADQVKLAKSGGAAKLRGKGLTVDAPLAPLMSLPLAELTAPVIEAWAARESKTRPTPARLALRCLKAFLNWCADQPEYAVALTGTNPAKSKRARESLGKAGVKTDALLREQLPAWFAAVRQLGNATTSAYLQVLLLTGARPGEVLALRWEDTNLQWRGLTIRDKVEGLRVIPLTPYVAQLIAALPRRNGFVFGANPRGEAQDTPIASPNVALARASKVAGVEGLTLHGLRRSFKSLTEWQEIPAGVVAQLMGHKPSATAEKHYTVRPLDLLRIHHEKIEAWILEQAGQHSVDVSAPQRLVAVK